MSKAFTDAAILLLAEEGKLSIDDPVTRWIVEAPATWKSITLHSGTPLPSITVIT